jgi:hypothetical protein
MDNENQRVFEVSKVRIGVDGHVSDVPWTDVNGKFDQDVSARIVAPVADVVDAIHDGAQVVKLFSSSKEQLPERAFVIVAHENGRECIAFYDLPSPGRNLADIASLDN